MRILFITAAFLPESIGGVELHAFGIARALAAQGHEVAVFTRGAREDRPEFDLERYVHGGIAVARLNYRFSDCDRFEKVYRNPAITERFAAFAAEWRPDVVHVHHLTCLSTDLLDAARAAGATVVLTLHDFWMGCPRGQRMTRDLELCEDVVLERCAPCLESMWSGWFGVGRDGPGDPVASRARDVAQLRDYHAWIAALLARADALVAPSASTRALFERQGVPPGRIRVVENGLDGAALRAPRAAGRGRFRFGFIGSVLPTKGVHVLIDAFDRLCLDGRDDVELHVHGEALPWHEVTGYGERLRADAQHLGARVRFHGRYEPRDLPGILASLDALVVPSLWFEAFCLTLREGWLAGVPVIASRLGAMAEGVDDGTTGLLFEPGDAADLARQMARLRDDAALRARLIASHKPVRTVEQNAADLLAVYAGAGAPC